MSRHTTEMKMVSTAKLIPYVNNARTHSQEQVNKLRGSLREFGFINPVIIDADYNVIAGHGRLMAAKEEGIEEVPCVLVDYLTEAQKKAYILADNRYAQDAGWDEELLRLEIESLEGMDFDVSLTGFDDQEIADLLAGDADDAKEDDFDVEEELKKPCFSKPGDIWHIGKHRVICGDSTLPETYEKLMDGKKANLVCTDPPYFVVLENASGKIANDDLDDKQGYEFLMKAFTNFKDSMANDASIYVFYATMKARVFYDAYEDAGFKVGAGLIWKKPRAPLMRTDWKFNMEPIIWGWKKEGKHKWYGDQKQKSTGETGGTDSLMFENHSQDSRYRGPLDVSQTISSTFGMGGNNQPFVVQPPKTYDVRFTSEGTRNARQNVYETDTSRTIDTGGNSPDSNQGGVAVVQPRAFGVCSKNSNSMKSDNPNSGFYAADTSRCLDANGGNPTCNQGGIAVIEGNGSRPSHRGDGYKKSDIMYTLNATEQHAVAFAEVHATLSANDGPKGPSSQMMKNPEENFVGEPSYGIGRPAMNQGYNAKFSFQIEEEVEPTLVAAGASGVAHPVFSSSKASFFTSAEEELANTLVATDYKDPPIVNDEVETDYIVRRLTPTECARLQGFPDWWCDDLGIAEPADEDIARWREVFENHAKAIGKTTKPKSDAQIRKWLQNPQSDSAEYKMWGNGVALPNVYFVLSGIMYYAQLSAGK